MSITIHPKQNYGFLFSSLGATASTAANGNFLADYASIKNGSYAKLMKAYYAEDSASGAANKIVKKNASPESADVKALAGVQSATDRLKESADALLVKGSKSLFREKDITTEDENGVETTERGYDTSSIYSAVSSFVKDYNSVIKDTEDVNSSSIQNRVKSMTYATSANHKMLSQIGISVNKDNTLSIDKEGFLNSDMNTVKSLFNGTGSFGYRVSAQASMINFSADREAAKAGTYKANGMYGSNYASGNIFNGFF